MCLNTAARTGAVTCFLQTQGGQGDAPEEHVMPALQSAAGQISEPAGQSAARSNDTYSLLSRDDVVGCLRSPKWQTAVQIEGLSARLRNFCGVCGQWISSKPCALRNHVRRMHVQAWKLCPDASHLSSTLSIARSKPCGACGVMTSRNTVHKCSLMFHLCLLKLFLQVKDKPPATLINYVSGGPSHDTGRGDEPSFPVCNQAAGSGLQYGRDNCSTNGDGRQLEQGGAADQMAKGEFQRRLQEGQRQYWSKNRSRAKAARMGLKVKWEDKDRSSQHWNRDLDSLKNSFTNWPRAEPRKKMS